jgi:hypothetical protein
LSETLLGLGVTSKDFLIEKEILDVASLKELIYNKTGNFSLLESLAVCEKIKLN